MKKVIISIVLTLVAIFFYNNEKVKNTIFESKIVQSTKEKISKTKKEISQKVEKNSENLITTSKEKIEELDFKKITEETYEDFKNTVIPEKLPLKAEDRHLILENILINSQSFLSEVSIGNIQSNSEEVAKALKMLILYTYQTGEKEYFETLLVLEKKRSDLFNKSLQKLNSKQQKFVREGIEYFNSMI